MKKNYNNKRKSSGGKKKSTYKGNSRNSRTSEVKSEIKESESNDPAWYSQNEAMLRDSASFPFNEATGTPIDISDNALGDYQVTIPGVLCMAFKPTMGRSNVETSGLNVASKKLFNTLRAFNNAGNPPYDPNDLMLVEGAIANVYAYINMCVRAYGVLNLFVYKNRYFPKVLVEGLNLDYDDFRDHMSQFRWDIDYMIQAIASLWAPGNIPYFAQCAQMYSGYFVEGEDVKDQIYVAVPHSFLQYEEASTQFPGGRLKPLTWLNQGSSGGLHTRADLINYFNALVAPLMNNTDVNIISGDVRKAFGDNIIKVGDVPLNYQVLPTADLTMLEKFKNANCLLHVEDTEIYPDPSQGYLISKPKSCGEFVVNTATLTNTVKKYGGAVVGAKKLLTTIRTSVTPSDVMEMTRWTPMIIESTKAEQTSSSNKRFVYDIDCGTYVPISFYTIAIDPTNGNTIYHTYSNYLIDNGNSVGSFWANLSNFKFHPEVKIYQDFGNVAGTAGSSYDIDNYTTVGTQDIHRMNDAALFSLFNA